LTLVKVTRKVPMGPPAAGRVMLWTQEDPRTWLAYGRPWDPWEARCWQVDEAGPWSWQVWHRGQRLAGGEALELQQALEQATGARWDAARAVRRAAPQRGRDGQGWSEAKKARERERALATWRAGRFVMRTAPEQPAEAGGK
jgi:hypothetical protein